MFSLFSKKLRAFYLVAMSGLILSLLVACNSEPPKPMKAVKQFDTVEKRDEHIAFMRKNHMDALKHKRDETMYLGIRTEEHSIKACINCHVPEKYNGKVLRHSDPEHFCSTCHTYVAAQLDCFECHADHPVTIKNSTADHSVKKLAEVHVTQLDNKQAGNKLNVKGETASE